MNADNNGTGEIITFYSYKGGTGRTLALANVACLLAREFPSEKVLMVDWDLEAPGLDRYFRDHIKTPLISSWKRSGGNDERPGLIDLFLEVDRRSRDLDLSQEELAAKAVQAIYDEIGLEKFILDTDIAGLQLMKSGRFDAQYPSAVNSFNWASLFARSEWLIRLFADELKKRYRYVLIDSRTGITDTSGICTTLLPDKLVVVYTPNRQSLTGIKDLVQSATDYRRSSDDVRPLVVFPLPSRVEASRPSLRQKWRFSTAEQDFVGYQPMFQELLQRVYDLPACNLQEYFDEVQIQHVADFAYGEEIAVLTEGELSLDRFSLTRSFSTFTARLVHHSAPWAEIDPNIATRPQSIAETSFQRAVSLAVEIGRKHKTALFAWGLGFLILCLIGGFARQQWALMVAAEDRLKFKELSAKLDADNRKLLGANEMLQETNQSLQQALLILHGVENRGKEPNPKLDEKPIDQKKSE